MNFESISIYQFSIIFIRLSFSPMTHLFLKNTHWLIIWLILTLLSCGPKTPKSNDPKSLSFIASYTDTWVARDASILVSFSQIPDLWKDTSASKALDLLQIEPKLEGKAVWKDAYTIEFTPDQLLKAGTCYAVTVPLDELFATAKGIDPFVFELCTAKPYFQVEMGGLYYAPNAQDLEKAAIKGKVFTSDFTEASLVEACLEANQKELGNNLSIQHTLSIKWEHTANGSEHTFTIENVQRLLKANPVELSWDASTLGAEEKGKLTYQIPALKEFSVLDVQVHQGQEQYAEIIFSDPIPAQLDQKGLIRLGGNDPQMIIEGNRVKVFPADRLHGNISLEIAAAFQNILQTPLPAAFSAQLEFTQLPPDVQILAKGSIVPSFDPSSGSGTNSGSENLKYYFKATGFKALDYTITKIHSNNVLSFFQRFGFGSRNTQPDEIRRLGTVVAKGTVSLTQSNPEDYFKFKTYALDLRKLIQPEKGEIYQIHLGIQDQYAVYACEGSQVDVTPISSTSFTTAELLKLNNRSDLNPYDVVNPTQLDDAYISSPNDYSPWDEEGGSYEDYSNPCKKAYYYKWENRNLEGFILASDLAMTVKVGAMQTYHVMVANISNAEPQTQVKIKAFDYRLQLIQEWTTNDQGVVSFQSDIKPAFFVAEDGKQKAYMSLDQMQALSLNTFDVSGETIQEGMKGFVFGERGVWRPGDTLFLTCMVENKTQALPAGLPATLELYSPKNQMMYRMIQKENQKGFYVFKVPTQVDDPTGTWLAEVKIGSARFSQNIRIETILPNRLKIALNFDASSWQKEGILPIVFQSTWLHGAPARNLKGLVKMRFESVKIPFPAYSDFSFYHGVQEETEEREVWEGKTNPNGEAQFTFEAPTSSENTLFNAVFRSKITEEGGAFSISKQSIPYYNGLGYVGIKAPNNTVGKPYLITDETHAVPLVLVDAQGRPLSRSVKLEVYKLKWVWWYENDDNPDYQGHQSKDLISSQMVDIRNGKGQGKFQIPYPQWGRYLLIATDTLSGHQSSTIAVVDWLDGGGSASSVSSADLLFLRESKTSYLVGEQAEVIFEGGGIGQAWVTIESGSKVLSQEWIKVQSGPNKYSFEVQKDMAPNVYVSVHLLQPHAQTLNDHPLRMYGVAPIEVKDPNTLLEPLLTTAATWEPLQKTTVEVKEAKGKPMTYVLALVDEGLLDLTNYTTPQPHKVFFSKEALGIQTYDLYPWILGAKQMELARVLGLGGDAASKGGDKNRANRFKPMVRFLGPFTLEANQKQKHYITLPNYIGSVKVMLIAGQDGAYGSVDKVVPVRKSLMVLATLPRILSVGDRFDLPMTVFNMTTKDMPVQLSIQTQGTVLAKQKSIQGIVPAMSDKTFSIPAQASVREGKATVSVKAISGKEQAFQQTEIMVQNPNEAMAFSKVYEIPAGQTKDLPIDVNAYTGKVGVAIELSSLPALNLEKRLQYLIHYPYGCVEQTTSGIFPQLFLPELVDLTPEQKKATQANVQAGIQRLKKFQLPSGGFSYWPGEQEVSLWNTSYAGMFLHTAQKMGYAVPNQMLKSWKNFQIKAAKAWVQNQRYASDPTVQAFRLMSLALVQTADVGAMNRLKETSYLPKEAQQLLSASYHLIGQESIALKVAQTNYQKNVYRLNMYDDYYYGSSYRDQALHVLAYALGQQKAQTQKGLQDIARWMSSGAYLNTQEMSFGFWAVYQCVQTLHLQNGLKVQYQWMDKKENIQSSKSLVLKKYALESVGNQTGKNQISVQASVRNLSKGSIYVTTTLTAKPMVGKEQALQENIELNVTYLNEKGKPIDVKKLKSGTHFYAKYRVKNTHLYDAYQHLALRQIFPACWEINNDRLQDSESAMKNDLYSYLDIRDDRVYTFLNLSPGVVQNYYVSLTAAYAGKFYLPAQGVQDMYRSDVKMQIPGRWVEVSMK